MSQWRLAVRALYEMGGAASTKEVADHGFDLTVTDARRGLRFARSILLVTGDGRRGGSGSNRPTANWQITDLGRKIIEGSVSMTRRDRSGKRLSVEARCRMPQYHATWLAALPRDVRITCSCPRCSP